MIKTRPFAEESGVIWCHAPVAAKGTVGLIEKAVDILQRVLKNCTPDPCKWPSNLPEAVHQTNKRYNLHHTFLPYEVLFGLILLVAAIPKEDDHALLILEFVYQRTHCRQEAQRGSEHAMDIAAQKHDLGINSPASFNPGDLLLLFHHRQSGKKMRPSWRGPFVVTGYGSDMG
ncbi:hypothetical protein EPUL_000421, partial [Erysiphe pulchra]